MEEQNIRINYDGAIATVTIDRAEKRNAIDYETQQELINKLEALEKDNEVRVIILTGAGEKTFAAGADIGKLKDRTSLESLQSSMQHLTNTIADISKPIIAAINGFALGGGCEISIACDIRIASDNAKLGLPELGLGIIPGGGGTQRLTALIGAGKAKEMIFTGDILTAEEAERIGLINKVTTLDQLLPTAKEIANKILKKGPVALSLAKLSIDQVNAANLQNGLQVEKLSQAVLMNTEDKLEGTSAFLNKRQADFKGK